MYVDFKLHKSIPICLNPSQDEAETLFWGAYDAEACLTCGMWENHSRHLQLGLNFPPFSVNKMPPFTLLLLKAHYKHAGLLIRMKHRSNLMTSVTVTGLILLLGCQETSHVTLPDWSFVFPEYSYVPMASLHDFTSYFELAFPIKAWGHFVIYAFSLGLTQQPRKIYGGSSGSVFRHISVIHLWFMPPYRNAFTHWECMRWSNRAQVAPAAMTWLSPRETMAGERGSC